MGVPIIGRGSSGPRDPISAQQQMLNDFFQAVKAYVDGRLDERLAEHIAERHSLDISVEDAETVLNKVVLQEAVDRQKGTR